MVIVRTASRPAREKRSVEFEQANKHSHWPTMQPTTRKVLRARHHLILWVPEGTLAGHVQPGVPGIFARVRPPRPRSPGPAPRINFREKSAPRTTLRTNGGEPKIQSECLSGTQISFHGYSEPIQWCRRAYTVLNSTYTVAWKSLGSSGPEPRPKPGWQLRAGHTQATFLSQCSSCTAACARR